MPSGPSVQSSTGIKVDLTSFNTSDLAKEVKQDTCNTSLASIDTKTPSLVGGKVPVDGSGVTQPVSAVSLPLPTGAATSANQTTANSSLSSIDGKLPSTIASESTLLSVANKLPDLPESTANLTSFSSGSYSIKGSSGHLFDVFVSYTGTGTIYLQIHDAANVGSCSNSTIFRTFELSNVNPDILIEFGDWGWRFNNGCIAVYSSTKLTYTISTGSNGSLSARYK